MKEMTELDWLYYLDILGVLVFAISGALTAIDNDFDIVGSTVIGFITALGGGTLRDILIGETPVGWMLDSNYLICVVVAIVLSYTFKGSIIKLKRSMFLFDTIGIGVFTVLGVQKTLSHDLEIPVALMMGVVSAVFGGVIRDVLTNEIPLIFRKEVYASACLLGGSVFVALDYFISHFSNVYLSILVVIVIRYLSVKYNWSLKLKA